MPKMRPAQILLGIWFGLLLTLNVPTYPAAAQEGSPNRPQPGPVPPQTTQTLIPRLFLPLVNAPRQLPGGTGLIPPSADNPRINIPAFPGDVVFSETAVLWFGQVNNTSNYTDVRMGYNPQEMWVRLGIFDHSLWTENTPQHDHLLDFDAVSLYLETDAGARYRFSAQLSWTNNNREKYEAAEVYGQSGWQAATLPFDTQAGWRGNAPNDDKGDRGWTLFFHIPFSSLNLAGAPPPGTFWRLGFEVYDRDDAAFTPIPVQRWPERLNNLQSTSWGQLHFGLPGYSAPNGLAPSGTSVIRHKLDGATVVDGTVGGGTVCGQGLDFWSEWGEKNWAGEVRVNIQNQYDVADWPCYAKDYLTFPLDRLPAGAQVISASLTLYQLGNAGGGDWGEPPVSLIQVFTVAEDWNEHTLTWNNAPLALENVSQARVEPITSMPDSHGVPRVWDVSRAVAQSLAVGQPSLRLALYSADGPYHSGKYFFFSDVEDWNAVGRPTLKVTWGLP